MVIRERESTTDNGAIRTGPAARVDKRSFVILVVLLWLLPGSPVQAEKPRDFISVYGGVNFEERVIEFIREASPTFQRSYIGALSYTHSWARTGGARWELEGQLVRHSGLQQLWEINVVPAVRWMDAPWDHIVDTRFAIGWGLSWASEEPPIEPRQEDEPGEGESARLLSYTLLEIEFMPPQANRWSGFMRIHHRSGVGGLFGGVEGGSNFLATGVRYYF